MKIMQKSIYDLLVSDIGQLLEEGRRRAAVVVNTVIVSTYWQIGKQIVEYEQKGKERAEYGSSLINRLSADLTVLYGKGFSADNLERMRRFYLAYPISATVSRKLPWSHYVELLKLGDVIERRFYEKQCMEENWGIRELRRQISSGLFYRLPPSKTQKGLLQLSCHGQIVRKAEDIVKDPYIFEFLGLQGNVAYSEREMENRIAENLQMFLLELGNGFSFVARQFKMTIGHKHFYADIVFYHNLLRCYVIVELKIGALSPKDIGQMNLYLNYFKDNVNKEGNAEPIGIILAKEKGNIEVKYALGGMSNNLFVSKYMLSLPSLEDLKKVVEMAKKETGEK